MESNNAIVKTLLYSDIFDFPLTKNELWQYLMTDLVITKGQFEKSLIDLLTANKPLITKKDDLYCMHGREKIIVKRQKNASEVTKKLKLADKAVAYLSYIPTISFIGLSGGLSVGKATKHDDIDLFIITKKNTLFLTRLYVLFVLEVLGLRRRRIEPNPADKICTNFFLDETHLSWPKQSRDIYIAHEIAQLKPLFERNNTHKIFLQKNRWVQAFLPNTLQAIERATPKNVRNFLSLQAVSLMLRPAEPLASLLQKSVMKRHQTTETITKERLALHPNDYRPKTMRLLRLKCSKLGLLTNP
jgi:hypothetical protein